MTNIFSSASSQSSSWKAQVQPLFSARWKNLCIFNPKNAGKQSSTLLQWCGRPPKHQNIFVKIMQVQECTMKRKSKFTFWVYNCHIMQTGYNLMWDFCNYQLITFLYHTTGIVKSANVSHDIFQSFYLWQRNRHLMKIQVLTRIYIFNQKYLYIQWKKYIQRKFTFNENSYLTKIFIQRQKLF